MFRPRRKLLLRARSNTTTLKSSRLTRRLRRDLILISQIPRALHSNTLLNHDRALHIVVLPLGPIASVRVVPSGIVRAQESLRPDPDEEGAEGR